MSNLFSFSGRVRRTEYFVVNLILSFIASAIGFAIGVTIFASGGGESSLIIVCLIAFLALTWVGLAAGTKRCHDRGNSGFYQLIPFYGLWMLFGDGEHGSNRYGADPKGRVSLADLHRQATNNIPTPATITE